MADRPLPREAAAVIAALIAAALAAALAPVLAVVGSALLILPARPASAQGDAARLQACGACHGADGHAPLENVPSLAAQPKVFLETQLVMIREGLREIPQMKGLLDGLPDTELTAIASHYASLPAKPPPSGRDEALFDRGRQVAEAMRCGSCHLPDYRGREQMPRLAGQREDYLLYSMKLFVNNQATGRDTIMAASLHGATETDLKAMAHFLSRLP